MEEVPEAMDQSNSKMLSHDNATDTRTHVATNVLNDSAATEPIGQVDLTQLDEPSDSDADSFGEEKLRQMLTTTFEAYYPDSYKPADKI